MRLEREQLINEVIALGEELQERAEKLVPQNEAYSSFTISADFDPESCPSIDISFTIDDDHRIRLLLEDIKK